MCRSALINKLSAHSENLSIIADFDGVLAHDNTKRLLDTCYQVVSRYHSFDYAIFESMFKALVPCPLSLSVDFLLKSIGLTHIKQELVEAILDVGGDITSAMDFVNYCKSANISLYVLSSGHAHAKKYQFLIEYLGASRVIATTELSKSNPLDYARVIDQTGVDREFCLYIDDCPAALNSAKLAGLNTAMMTNEVFRRTDIGINASYVDQVFDDWNGALSFIAEI
ncbi:HAD family hydrolase [Corallincola luteus]|nr:HAD family hydrolase [Corallincola luteus]